MRELSLYLMWLLFGLSLCKALAAAEPNQGYYAGLSIKYPYKPVYCDCDPLAGDESACYGSPGDLVNLPMSAPLPLGEKWCVWADTNSSAPTNVGWYQWKPRDVPAGKQKYYGEKVCYFEDRGASKDINDLER